MKKRLSKIARDLNANISDVAEFLRVYGIDFEEDPNESFSDEIILLIENNFPAFINQKRKEYEKLNKSKYKNIPIIDEVPLELRIVEAGNKEKKLIERIVGFTEFDWDFTVAKYKGECSQPVDFNLFDEVLCDLLIVEPMSAIQMGKLLGFDIEKDPAEKEILFKAIKDLEDDKMIEGDESIMWLSSTGMEYASNGVKFSTFTRNFELYFDSIASSAINVKSVFSKLKSEKSLSIASNIPNSLKEIRELAEHQAPEIHFPEKNYLLQSAELISSNCYRAKLWVILLENFRESTLRALVYDEKQNIIIESLSDALDKQESIKKDLLEKLVRIDEEIEFTEEEKQVDQIEIESELIQKQDEIDAAIARHDDGIIKEIHKEAEILKRHFNSLEFEVELKRLFDETANDLWIISPWIKNATLKRIPFFERYLKKGGRIFIAYSEPERPDQIMAFDEPLNKLWDLERRYQNFYLHQLPAFHYKNVWLREEGGRNLYYTGSYNILSFFVSQGLRKVRQEKMTKMDWNSEIQEEYVDVIKSFGLKYVNKIIEDFDSLSLNPPEPIDRNYLQKLKAINYGKLTPFINKGINKFDEAYKKLEETKSENLNYYRRIYFENKIQGYRQQVVKISNQSISPERKKSLALEFEKLRDEYMDFLDLQMSEASEVADLISNLKVLNLSNKRISKSKRI